MLFVACLGGCIWLLIVLDCCCLGNLDVVVVYLLMVCLVVTMLFGLDLLVRQSLLSVGFGGLDCFLAGFCLGLCCFAVVLMWYAVLNWCLFMVLCVWFWVLGVWICALMMLRWWAGVVD